ncbi:hypothetical protein BsWGS_10529 [Bradybaena similaris]
MDKLLRTNTKQSVRTVSKADFKKTVFDKSQASLPKISTATIPLEFKCLKHSPRVGRKESLQALERSLFEAATWQNTFDAMGALQKLKLRDFVPFTTLNKSPYHCLSMSRHYEVSYGKMSQVEGASVKGFGKKKDLKPSVCSCIEYTLLPKVSEPLTLRSIADNAAGNKSRKNYTHYTPKSCVLVWWDARRFNTEKICEWLQSFGPYFFTINKGTSTILVCFESIQSAYRAVNTPTKPGISITWNDVRFYNNGYFRQYQGYTLGKDAVWIRHFSQKRKPASKVSYARPERGQPSKAVVI